MGQERAYRCCGHCERTLQKLGANNVQIDDIWKTAILSTETGSDKAAYPYRELRPRNEIVQLCMDLKNA